MSAPEDEIVLHSLSTRLLSLSGHTEFQYEREGGGVFFVERNKREEKGKERGGKKGKKKKMKAAMSYEARFSRIKLAKVAARVERFDRSVVFRSQVCGEGCPDRVCLVNLLERNLFSKLYTI